MDQPDRNPRAPEKPTPGIASSGPAAMSRVLRLLDHLARNPQGLTLSQISQALGGSKSTFLATLRGLAADGFLVSDGSIYRLGSAAFRLAGTILAAGGQSDLTRHYVRELASRTHESVGYAIADWDIGQVIYTEGVNSTQPVHYAMRAGIRGPLYATAAGRVMLAYGPAEKREAYLARGRFKAFTDETETTAAGLQRRLEEIRRLGYCASFGEMLKETAAIAVPVYDSEGVVGGALMIAAPIERMRTNFDRLLGEVRRAGRLASGLPETE